MDQPDPFVITLWIHRGGLWTLADPFVITLEIPFYIMLGVVITICHNPPPGGLHNGLVWTHMATMAEVYHIWNWNVNHQSL